MGRGNGEQAGTILYGDVGSRNQTPDDLYGDLPLKRGTETNLLKLIARQRMDSEQSILSAFTATEILLDIDPDLRTGDGRHVSTGDVVKNYNALEAMAERGYLECVNDHGGMTGFYLLTPKGLAALEQS